MASSKSSSRRVTKNKERRLVLYAVPIIAVILTGGVLALSLTKPPQTLCADKPNKPVALDFQAALSIQIVNNLGNQTRFIVTPAVGLPGPGAFWATDVYNAYGTNGRYPVCSDAQVTGTNYPGYNTIHVKSTTAQNYTLRDYFNVWGQPLGKNGTDTTLDPNYVIRHAGYQWEMCIGNPTSPANLSLGNWTYEPLVPGRFITLVYYNTNSAYPGCFG